MFIFHMLNYIVNKYNSTYHNNIKMKPIDFKYNSYAWYSLDSNAKDPNIKISDHVIISKYKNIFAKDLLLIGMQKFL